MSNKEKYRRFCRIEHDLPIFSQDWWLDAVCGKDNWDVILVESAGQIVASMPIFLKKVSIFYGLGMPKLTQTLGPYIKFPTGQKYETALSYQKKILERLIELIPPCDFFVQNFNYRLTNWLPFFWASFEQKTRYTYILESLVDLDYVWESFNNKLRTDIRKAAKELDVVCTNSLEDFFAINQKTFLHQNVQMPYDLDFAKKIDNACTGKDCRKIFLAVDKDNNVHGGVYIVWDVNSAYYLMGGSDSKLRINGAMGLLLWSAIKFASTVTKRFDFEGSMIKPIEHFFRSFGAIQKPYFHIYKYNSGLLRFFYALKAALK